jgi:hypothetical protein
LASCLAGLWLVGIIAYLAQQEVPRGGLQGNAVAEESGQPLPGAVIHLSRSSGAPTTESTEFTFRTRRDGSFRIRRIPAGGYRLEASSRAHKLGPVSLTVEEGRARPVTLELSPIPSFLHLSISQHTVTPDEMPQVLVRGFVQSQALDFRCYRIDPAALFERARGNLRSLLPATEPSVPSLDSAPALTPAAQLSAPITRRDPEGLFRQRVDLSGLRGQPGIYLVVASADSVEEKDWVLVTSLGMVLKRWGDQALAFVADLKSGQPVPGAAVRFSVGNGRAVSTETDQEGICQVRLSLRTGQEQSLLVRAEKDGSQAFLRADIYAGEEAGQERIYSYTDRPVYRPGQMVNFKGIARRFAAANYSVLPGQAMQVQVWDPRETLVYKENLTTNRYGSFYGQLHLNDEAATGLYRLVTTLEGRPHESYFKVAEYRKPEYTVTVKTGKKRYLRGETIQAEALAQYYFGAPVAGAQVRYLVRRSPYFFYPAEDEEYAAEQETPEYEGEGEGYGYGEVVEEGKAETDGEGLARFAISTKRPVALSRRAEEGEEEARDYQYTVDVTVTDPSRKEVGGQGSALVTQGEFALFVRPTRNIATPGEPTEVEILARDYDGRPVRGVRVDLAAGPELWQGRESKFEQEARGSLVTDEKGKGLFRFTPQSQGSYRIQARASDRLGNQLRGSSYLWAFGEEYSDLEMPYPELQIVTSKPVYRQGETAVLLINSKLKGATALLTVEGPRIYEHRLVTLRGNSTRVEVPVKPEYAPNFFVAVAVIRNARFAEQKKRVRVSGEERQLQISVKPNKERYTPGERAVYGLRTADSQGRPTPAELSVGVVDESIYAIQGEMVEPMLRFFYPPRENSVSTSYSFAQIYLDANKEPASVKVRKRFPDTAYWNPTVITGADGRAQVSFLMPDTLTTWRATVRGATLDTAVGEAVAKVKCSKDLLVRLEMPRFLTQKDRATLSAVAHNYTRVSQSLDLRLEAEGLRFLSGPKSGERVSFPLAADGVRRQDWQVEAPAPEAVEVTAYLQAKGGLSDAMALPLPVRPHGRERVEWRSGAVSTSATERLPVRKDAVAGASELRVRLSPSIASVVLGALDYLARYPYGCTEQTMSAFLPDVMVARALRGLGLPNARLEQKLPDMVQAGLNRLYGYQHDDGGWGWWRYDQSEPWMTAYVVFGLIVAKQNGFPVNEAALSRGVDWLANWVKRHPPAPIRERIYPLYVLSLAGRGGPVDEQLSGLYRARGSLDAHTLALLTSALLAREREAPARAAAGQLWRQGQETQALLSWRGGNDWGRADTTETTALAFQALAELFPDDPRLFKVVRWLVLNREGNHWVSTRDTAFIVYALTDFLQRSQELKPDYEAAVALNGKPILTRRFAQTDLFSPEVEIEVSGSSLRQGDNLLSIDKQGAGNLYYTLMLRQFVGQEDMTKLITGAGISIDRQYYRMATERGLRGGAITTAPAPRPTTDFRSGEAILARLTITSPRQYDYVVVEDPLPAGCEAVEQGDLFPWEWDRWYSDMEVRDEKVAVFARRLPAGKSTIEYHLRPQIPGQYHVMPTEVYSMYNPELRGSGAEARVSVR